MQLQVVALALAHAPYPPRHRCAPPTEPASPPRGTSCCTRARAVTSATTPARCCCEVRARTPFDLQEIDIETSDALLGEYGLRIPVVVVDGSEAFEYTVDPGELERRSVDDGR